MFRMARCRVVAAIVIALQGGTLFPAPLLIRSLQAQTVAFSPAVRQGMSFWQDEKYLEAVTTLRNALKDPALTQHDRVQALATIGQCHVRLHDETAAIATFQELLNLDSKWAPDPAVFLDDERATFEKARASWTPPETPHRAWWKRPWVLGLGGAAIGGLALALAGGSGGSKSSPVAQALPGPPNPPGN